MQILLGLLVVVIGYLLGAIPSGWIVVKIANGKDIRSIGSGRTGGTNAMRAAGWLAGFFTGLLDVLKGLAVGWIAGTLVPGSQWVLVTAVIFTVIGQIKSIFLAERDENGRLHLRGGAGGATCLGGAIALWPQAWTAILPIGVAVYLLIGYASVTTISIAFVTLVGLGYRAWFGDGPWTYVVYGVASLIVVIYALQPNLERLKNGTERAVGLRALQQRQAANASASRGHLKPGKV
jgi:acyl phosphate:glycerol-3-phosphate acyltransferase